MNNLAGLTDDLHAAFAEIAQLRAQLAFANANAASLREQLAAKEAEAALWQKRWGRVWDVLAMLTEILLDPGPSPVEVRG